MKPLTILVTGAGAPGIVGTIYSLRHNFDARNITILGTDVDPDAVGGHFCDKHFTIPPARNSEKYLDALQQICAQEKVDVLLPQNTAELAILSRKSETFERIGTKVVVASERALELSNNKYELMRLCLEHDVPTARFALVSDSGTLRQEAEALGWPKTPVVVKPPVSNGLRGVRIIDETVDRKRMFFEEKPSSLYTNMSELLSILEDSFPEMIVMEYLPGAEFTVDVLRVEKKCCIVPRIRHRVRSGITFSGETVKNERIIEYVARLSQAADLQGCFGFQFKLDGGGVPRILEANPRVQGTMVLATLAGANLIYGAVKAVLGEPVPEFDVEWGTKLMRYWGGVGISGAEKLVFL